MNPFEKLHEDLAALQKSMTADPGAEEAAAAAAAAEADAAGGEGAATGETAGDGSDEKIGTAAMAKSMSVLDANGEAVEVLDATPLLKSLRDDNAALRAENASLAKVSGTVVDLLKGLNTEMQSLRKSVTALSAQGAGRKSVVTMPAIPAAKKDDDSRISQQDFLAKSMSAFDKGRINSLDVGVIEHHINSGRPIPDHLVRTVMAP